MSLAAVLVGDFAGSTDAGSYLENNSGPVEVRSVSPGGRDNEVRSSANQLAAHPNERLEEGASYYHEDEERLQADDDKGNDSGNQGELAAAQDDGEAED